MLAASSGKTVRFAGFAVASDKGRFQIFCPPAGPNRERFATSLLVTSVLVLAAVLLPFRATVDGLQRGRTGKQLYRSVCAYLEWRAGITWRDSSQRFDAERLYYLNGLSTLTQAWNSLEPSSPEMQETIRRCEYWQQVSRDYLHSMRKENAKTSERGTGRRKSPGAVSSRSSERGGKRA